MPPQLRLREGGHPGQKWVDDNFDLKQDLMRANNGVMPHTPAFTTSEFPGSNTWSEDNPPLILFYIQCPDTSALQTQLVPSLRDAGGNTIKVPDTDRYLRDLPNLPRRIALDVPGWMVEAWRRSDPRISYEDIVDRMTTDLGDAAQHTERVAKIPTKNMVQNHCRRNCRKVLNNYTCYNHSKEPRRVELTALQHLTVSNIHNNTVLDIVQTPSGDRLAKKRLVRKFEEGGLAAKPLEVTNENHLQTTLPLNHFTQGFIDPFTVTESMERALELLAVLQERACLHGYDADDWEKLPRDCMPASWYNRQRGKEDKEAGQGKKSHKEINDDGCEICTWKDPEEHADVNKPTSDTDSSSSSSSSSSASDELNEDDDDDDDEESPDALPSIWIGDKNYPFDPTLPADAFLASTTALFEQIKAGGAMIGRALRGAA